jgi:hypothetical protein
MLIVKWFSKMVLDTVALGYANRSPGISLSILALLVIGVVIAAAQISAPFIYTLF